MVKKKKILIGRTDIVDFPLLNLLGIKAKIDTGAFTSSIHVRNIKVETRGDRNILTCHFSPGQKTIFQNFSQKMVKSSNGISQMRYVVQLILVIFGKEYNTEFTLNDRKMMTYPVLLGKKFLKGRFIVDVSAVNLSRKSKFLTL